MKKKENQKNAIQRKKKKKIQSSVKKFKDIMK